MARGEFASGEVLPSEKVLNYTFLFMENRIAKLVKYSFRPTSCLAASLREFELFIHELCRFALPHSKIQSCQHVKQCSRSRVLSLYSISDGRISDAEALSADVVATAVAIL